MSKRTAGKTPQSHTPPAAARAPNPAALGVADAARVLTAAGAKNATEANVAADVEAGSPTNADGTINLLHYAAWLADRANKMASTQ